MRQLISFLLLLLIISCKSSAKKESKTITITSDDVKASVAYLASDELKGRDTGSEGIEKAANYLEEQLKSFGVKPYFETYRDDFLVGDTKAFNVVGIIEGNDEKLKNEVVIIGAHYDHIGKSKTVEGDSIANGANDNAAGTSAVLAIAKYFSAKKNNKRSMMFVLFSAEEKGLLGSKHLAKKLKEQDIDLYTMVNFEMIGVPFKDRDYVAFATGYDLSNMALKINEYLGHNFMGSSEIAKKYNLFRQSDNYAFYKEFELPSHTISSCDLSNYDYYHHVDDEAEKLDYEHMASLINSVIPAIEKMSNTDTKEIVMYEE
ncbi:peptidase M28 [Flavobacteriales bacterium 33_180_T64]|nr:peptidase M28 [Flavobacteriales bacterium 33_180_T64]